MYQNCNILVYAYQNITIQYLKQSFEYIKKIFYFTDFAAQHFKNKNNFSNLLAHKDDFGIEAEWHFHATAHGKSACDGVFTRTSCNGTIRQS